MGTCTVSQCDRPSRSARGGLCPGHYTRQRRNGDPQAHIPLAPVRHSRPVVDHADGTRECQGCHDRKPMDQFHLDSKSPAGRRATCRKCRLALESERNATNRDRISERVKAYRVANPDLVRAQDAARYQRNKESRLAAAIAQSHIRRARIASGEWERGVTVPALRRRDGDECHYCDVPMVFGSHPRGEERPGHMATLEHKQAISRGGSHTFSNCVLACWRCNSAKGAKPYPSGVTHPGV